MTPTPLPYTGLRVLDISQGIAGPYCAHILWQQGAHVLKVEPPAGDWIRFVGVGKGDLSALAIQFNAGKQALALDARTEAGKKVLFDLALQADVIVQNFRPGVADRLGVGYATLQWLWSGWTLCERARYGFSHAGRQRVDVFQSRRAGYPQARGSVSG